MELYNLISDNPGLHLSKIAEMLNMGTSLAEYHLIQLVKDNLIVSVREKGGYYRRFYVKDSTVGIKEKEILSILRQKSLLKMVSLLLKDSSSRHKEILKNVDMAPSTLSHHLTKLVNSGIVEMSLYGKDKGYRLKNKEEIVSILKKHRLYVELQISIENLKDTWKDLFF